MLPVKGELCKQKPSSPRTSYFIWGKVGKSSIPMETDGNSSKLTGKWIERPTPKVTRSHGPDESNPPPQKKTKTNPHRARNGNLTGRRGREGIGSGLTWEKHTSLPLSTVLPSMVPGTRCQLQSETVKKNSRNKQFPSFKSGTILSSMKKSHAVLLQPTQDVNHPFIQSSHTVCSSPISHCGPPALSEWVADCCQCWRSRDPYFTSGWPQSTRTVMLAIQRCQRAATKCYLKWKSSSPQLNKERKRNICWGCQDLWEEPNLLSTQLWTKTFLLLCCEKPHSHNLSSYSIFLQLFYCIIKYCYSPAVPNL